MGGIKMHTLKKYLILIINIIYFQYFNAQSFSLKFDHLTAPKGLSSNNVICIIKDSRGFMWFGTDNGLNKYDGYNFTVYKVDPNNENSISHSKVLAIVEDRNSNIWIGTERGGLNLYERDNDRFMRFILDSSLENQYNASILPAILEDSKGRL